LQTVFATPFANLSQNLCTLYTVPSPKDVANRANKKRSKTLNDFGSKQKQVCFWKNSTFPLIDVRI